MNTLKILEDNFIKFSSKPLFISDTVTLTYQESMQKVSGIKDELMRRGIKDGDVVVVSVDDRLNCLLVYLACIVSGITFSPVSSAMTSRDRAYIEDLVGPKITITDEFLTPINVNQEIENSITKKSAGAIFFTSGTTGRPKGVHHSIDNMLSNALAFNKSAMLDEHSVMMHVMPAAYMAGILNTFLCPLMAGGTIVVEQQFNAQLAMKFWTLALNSGVNSLWVSPTMLSIAGKLTRDPKIIDWVTHNIDNIFVGTAPLSMTVRNDFEEKFAIKCRESYGMTEVMLISVEDADIKVKHHSVGRVLDDILVTIKKESDTDVSGEITLVTRYQMLGYVEKNKPLTAKNELFNSGDIGYVDKEGNLNITGRVKDLIIHGGINVSPRAVEDVLVSHENVIDSAVVGKEHAYLGEEVIAFIQVDNNEPSFTEGLKAELIVLTERSLQPDARPSQFFFVSEMPRTSTGKIVKNKLKEKL